MTTGRRSVEVNLQAIQEQFQDGPVATAKSLGLKFGPGRATVPGYLFWLKGAVSFGAVAVSWYSISVGFFYLNPRTIFDDLGLAAVAFAIGLMIAFANILGISFAGQKLGFMAGTARFGEAPEEKKNGSLWGAIAIFILANGFVDGKALGKSAELSGYAEMPIYVYWPLGCIISALYILGLCAGSFFESYLQTAFQAIKDDQARQFHSKVETDVDLQVAISSIAKYGNAIDDRDQARAQWQSERNDLEKRLFSLRKLMKPLVEPSAAQIVKRRKLESRVTTAERQVQSHNQRRPE